MYTESINIKPMFKKIWDQSDIPPDSKTKKRYCVNCKWCEIVHYVYEDAYHCTNPKFKREPDVSDPNIVTGRIWVRHHPPISCGLAREFEHCCGKSGKLFELKEDI